MMKYLQIEIVCGKHGEYYAQSWFKQIDKKYLKKIFCVKEHDHSVSCTISILPLLIFLNEMFLDEENLRGGDPG